MFSSAKSSPQSLLGYQALIYICIGLTSIFLIQLRGGCEASEECLAARLDEMIIWEVFHRFIHLSFDICRERPEILKIIIWDQSDSLVWRDGESKSVRPAPVGLQHPAQPLPYHDGRHTGDRIWQAMRGLRLLRTVTMMTCMKSYSNFSRGRTGTCCHSTVFLHAPCRLP